MAFFHTVPFRSRPAYFWYARAMMLEGIFTGAGLEMLAYVARKTIGVSEFQVTLLEFFKHLGMLLAFAVPYLVTIRSKIHFIAWTSVPCKIGFILLALFVEPHWFFAVAAAAVFLSKMWVPMNVAVLKSHYPVTHRATILGHVRTLEMVCTVLAAGAAGWIMDRHGGWFRWAFLLAAFFGLLATWCFTQIRERNLDDQQRIVSVSRIRKVIREDRVYFWYQFLFSISGGANLVGLPLYVLYVVDVVQASYLEISLSYGVLMNLVSLLTYRWWGRLIDRHSNPMAMRAWLSWAWCLHPLCFALASDMTMIYVAWGLYGFLFAGGQLNWMLGPLYFCSEKDAPVYSIIHTANTGLRGVVAPLYGYVLYRWLGFEYTFCILGAVMFLNGFAMYWLYLKTRHLERFAHGGSRRTD